MAHIHFNGSTINTSGDLPAVGRQAPEFVLTNNDLIEITLSDFSGKYVILHSFPSIERPVHAEAVCQFDSIASEYATTVVLSVSMDLPFALKNFSVKNNLNRVITASEFRHQSFGDIYGMRIMQGSFKGLLSPAVLVIDPNARIMYSEQVHDVSAAPNFVAIKNLLKNAVSPVYAL